MKNIHLIPTDKPSRLYTLNSSKKLYYTNNNLNQIKFTVNQNIYITSDEEITGFENYIWVYNNGRVWLWQNTMALRSDNKPRKIILTTDQDLIDLGVQSIDDEFLQWYIKNPSCERVEVKTNRIVLDDVNYNFDIVDYKCKIIIPKEETKLKNICIKCGVDLYATEGRFTCQQSECRGIIVSKETLQEWADNEERKRHLIEIMKGDEELGLYEEPKNSGKTLADMKCSCLRYVPGSFSANCRNCGLSPRTDNNSINRVGTFCDKCRQVMCQCKPTQETKLTFIEWIGLFRWMGKGW